MDARALPYLDAQVDGCRRWLRLEFGRDVERRVPSTVYAEVYALSEADHNRLRAEISIPPERYLDEMTAFQAWMELASGNETNPVVVRAQVITELYVGFVWLRDALLTPLAAAIPASTTALVVDYLSTDDRRHLRNAVSHGRWTYLPDFSGLEYWDGKPLERSEVSSETLGAWQTLSRATSIAALLALALPE